MPALLNAESMRPYRSTANATIAATDASSRTSTAHAVACPPSSVTSFTVAAAAASSTSATITDAPSRANNTDAARPIPLPPPVTSATLLMRLQPSALCQRCGAYAGRRLRLAPGCSRRRYFEAVASVERADLATGCPQIRQTLRDDPRLRRRIARHERDRRFDHRLHRLDPLVGEFHHRGRSLGADRAFRRERVHG